MDITSRLVVWVGDLGFLATRTGCHVRCAKTPCFGARLCLPQINPYKSDTARTSRLPCKLSIVRVYHSMSWNPRLAPNPTLVLQVYLGWNMTHVCSQSPHAIDEEDSSGPARLQTFHITNLLVSSCTHLSAQATESVNLRSNSNNGLRMFLKSFDVFVFTMTFHTIWHKGLWLHWRIRDSVTVKKKKEKGKHRSEAVHRTNHEAVWRQSCVAFCNYPVVKTRTF